MKKILIVGLSYKKGGIETYFYNLMQSIDRTDLSFDFLCFDKECYFSDYFKREGSNIFVLPSRKQSLFRFNSIIKKFFLKNSLFDYIWVNTSSTSMYQVQYYGKRLTNAKIITHSHGTHFENDSGYLRYFANKILDVINYKKVIKNTDYYFCCSLAAGDSLFGKKYHNKLTFISNGINVDDFNFNIQWREKIRNDYGIPLNSFVIGLVGRISTQKNPYRAVDIFYEYHQKNDDSFLLVVGEGELLDGLKQYCSDKKIKNIIFLGLRSDVNRIMSAIDLILMPSLFEGFPVSLIEAQASGLQCVVSDSITREASLSNLVSFISLKEENTKWCSLIEETRRKMYDKRNGYNSIVKKLGFDEKDSAQKVRGILTGNNNNEK